MTSFERVKLAIEHKEPDKIPYDLGGSVLTGMNINLYENLRDYLGLPKVKRHICDEVQQLAYIDDDVLDILKVDVRCVDPSPPKDKNYAKPIIKKGNFYKLRDEWGVDWKMPIEGGHYFDMVGFPLEDYEEPEDLNNYRFPIATDNARFATMKKRADKYVFNEKRAYILGRHVAGIWETALWTSGYNKFLCDMLINEKYACKVLDKILENKMEYWGKALDTVGENVLIVSEADDLATQISTLVSNELYKKLISPRHKILFEFMKKRAKSKIYIFYHSCGAVKSLIPTLIDEGIDILNPVQVSATGMDTKELKKEFGKDISFWGGGVDTQNVLPHGTVQEVKDEVKKRIDDLAPGGGFVFNPVHNLQSDVSPKNFMAMWDALQQYGKYN